MDIVVLETPPNRSCRTSRSVISIVVMILHEHVYFFDYNARQSTDVDYFIMSIEELGMLNYTFRPRLVLVCIILRYFVILFNTSHSVYYNKAVRYVDSCIRVPSPNVTIAI